MRQRRRLPPLLRRPDQVKNATRTDTKNFGRPPPSITQQRCLLVALEVRVRLLRGTRRVTLPSTLCVRDVSTYCGDIIAFCERHLSVKRPWWRLYFIGVTFFCRRQHPSRIIPCCTMSDRCIPVLVRAFVPGRCDFRSTPGPQGVQQ